MSVPTFSPPKFPSRRGLSMKSTPRIRRVDFEGGAYSQRAEDGPNPISRKLPLLFAKCTATERDAILSFFEDPDTGVNGIGAFYYTPPGEDTARLWTAENWTHTPSSGGLRWDVSINLRQENDIV